MPKSMKGMKEIPNYVYSMFVPYNNPDDVLVADVLIPANNEKEAVKRGAKLVEKKGYIVDKSSVTVNGVEKNKEKITKESVEYDI